MRSHLRLLTGLACFLLFQACNGVTHQTEEKPAATTKSQKESPSPTILGTGTQDLEAFACLQFFYTAKYAIEMHVEKKPSEEPKLLVQGLKKYLQEVQKRSSKSSSESKLKPFLDQISEKTLDCSLFQTIAAQLTWSNQSEDKLVLLLRDTLNMYLHELDAHSAYNYPTDGSSGIINSQLGTGVRLRMRTDYLLGADIGAGRKPPYYVISDFYNGSVNKDKKDLKGAKVLAIDHTAASDLYFLEAQNRLNSSDKPVQITIGEPDNRSTWKNVTLDVDSFHYNPTYFSWAGDPSQRIAYVKFSSFFNRSVTEEFLKESLSVIGRLFERGEDRIRGLILDFRGNLGGYEDRVATVLEAFLPQHSLVSQLRIVESNSPMAMPSREIKGFALWPLETIGELWEAEGENQVFEKPIIALQDRLTASASEIALGALSENRRVITLGESSFGKWVGQQRFSLGTGTPLDGSIQVTNHYLFTPMGHSYQGIGLPADLPYTDPELEWISKTEKLHVRMGDLPDKGDVIIQRPPDLVGAQFQPKAPVVTDRDLSYLKSLPIPKPSACLKTSDEKGYPEEEDCLLDVARQYMSSWLEYRKKLD